MSQLTPPIPPPEPLPATPPADAPADTIDQATAVAQPAASPAPGLFYRLDSGRVSLREYWWGVESIGLFFAFMVGVLLKVLRIRLPGSSDDPPVEALEPFQVEAEAFGTDARAQFEPLERQLQQAGFDSPVFHVIEDPNHSTVTRLATYRHADGVAMARIHQRIWSFPHPPKQYLFTEFITPLAGGRYVWSISAKPDMAWPQCCALLRRTGASPRELWDAHQQELSRIDPQSIIPIGDLTEAISHHHAAVRDFHVMRGVFRPMNEGEVRRTVAQCQANHAVKEAGLEHAEVLEELEKIQNKKTSWGNAILLLVISLALFFGVGALQFDRDFTFLFILIPVLLFHEAGHYVAMRLLKYRNVKMFFIPFLGAAVSGRNYNVAGWKKTLVFLAGPVPGILVAMALISIGLKTQIGLMMAIAVILLLLNGFNLLPIIPLDGGWIAHTLLFSRHYLLDIIFRSLAAAVLAIAGFYFDDKVLMALGLLMAMFVPAAYRLARITHDLRRTGLAPASPDHQTIPTPVAQEIIGRVKSAFPRAMNARTVAQHTLSIFESINGRPPGWAASIGLGAVYLGSIASVLVCGFILRDAVSANVTPAKYPLDPAHIAHWDGPRAPRSGPRQAAVGMFADPEPARSEFEALRSSLPENASMKLFGQSVIVWLPGARGDEIAAWAARWHPAGEVFTHPRSLHVTCLAPSKAAAEDIQAEVRSYGVPAELPLVPPWIWPDPRSRAQREAHHLARRTYWRILNTQAKNDAAADRLRMRMIEAGRARDFDQYDQLYREYHEHRDRLRIAAIGELCRLPADQIDARFVAEYLSLPAETRDQKFPATLAARLGTLPAGAASDPEPAGGVSAFHAKSRLQLRIDLSDRTSDPEAVVRWLVRIGCTELRYDIERPYQGHAASLPAEDPEPAER